MTLFEIVALDRAAVAQSGAVDPIHTRLIAAAKLSDRLRG